MIKRKKNSYIIFSIIFIVFGIFFSVISYLNFTKFQDMGQVVEQRNGEYIQLQTRKDYLNLISKNYIAMTENLTLLENKIGKSVETEDLYNSLLELNTLGTIESIGIGKVTSNFDYNELPITLKMTTDLQSMRRMFYSLKYKNRCFRVNDYSFEKGADNNLTATFNITAFSMK